MLESRAQTGVMWLISNYCSWRVEGQQI